MAKPIIVIQCDWCGKDVEKTLGRVNTAHKYGRNIFCNNSCASKYRAKQRRDNFIMPVEKQCKGCGETKLLCEFHVAIRNLDGRLNKCKICRAKYNRQQRKKRIYGLTLECEVEIFESQGGVCAICGYPLPLCVDHNHVTGFVRGLLCNNCNAGLGFLGDNSDNLRKAAYYLENEFNDQ